MKGSGFGAINLIVVSIPTIKNPASSTDKQLLSTAPTGPVASCLEATHAVLMATTLGYTRESSLDTTNPAEGSCARIIYPQTLDNFLLFSTPTPSATISCQLRL